MMRGGREEGGGAVAEDGAEVASGSLRRGEVVECLDLVSGNSMSMTELRKH